MKALVYVRDESSDVDQPGSTTVRPASLVQVSGWDAQEKKGSKMRINGAKKVSSVDEKTRVNLS